MLINQIATKGSDRKKWFQAIYNIPIKMNSQSKKQKTKNKKKTKTKNKKQIKKEKKNYFLSLWHKGTYQIFHFLYIETTSHMLIDQT